MNQPAPARRAFDRPIRLLWIIPVMFIALIAQNRGRADDHSSRQDEPAANPRAASRYAWAAASQESSLSRHAPGLIDQSPAVAPQASTGTTALFTPNGSGADTPNGDYVSSANALNGAYHFFIEVPPGLSRLVVDVFDPDVGLGGASEATAGRDRARNTGFETAANYTLIDPTGAARPILFTTGNLTQPAGADNAWLALYNGNGNNVLDAFSSASYSNNNGNQNWSAAWVETDSGGAGPNTGAITISGGQLRIRDNVSGIPSIERQANLSATGLSLQIAYLRFDFSGTLLSAGDSLNVQISNNGGGTYTTLETLTSTSTGTSRAYNITSFISANTRVRFQVAGGLNTAGHFFNFDNVEINDGGPLTAGHWELRVDMSSAATTGDDINAIGIRAHDGTVDSGGTELNVYADSIVPIGVNPPASGTASRAYTLFPYVVSGCACSKNDFDFDSNSGNTGSMNFASRTNAFMKSFASAAMSADDTWRRDDISGWTSDARSGDYGVWTATPTITSYLVTGSPNGNYASFYMGNFQTAANPPTANPVANAFRIYLPTDANAAPVKPYVEQLLTYAGPGPNPPAVGQTTTFTVTVRVVNPTSKAITFSTPSNLVTANIPGAGAIYGGSAQVSQGSVGTQPAVNGTGNITWNPGTVAAGATAILAYRVKVTPTSAGQRIPVTATPASGNGTRAQFVDETGNTTQSRATFLFGPLCELAAQVNVITAIELASFTARAYDGGVALRWETGFEIDNLGFRIYRDEGGRRVPVTRQMIAGSALVAGPGVALGAGRVYRWWDEARQGAAASYWLEEIDLHGRSKWHGPFATKYIGGAPPVQPQATALNDAGPTPSTSRSGAPLERTTTLAAPSPQALAAQANLAAQPALKLVVRREGWYRVTQPQMVAAGFDTSGDPRLLQLFVDGQQLPIKVITQNGQFNAASAIEFYGLGLDTAVTDARVYWLVNGSEPGLRIAPAVVAGLSSTARNFLYTVERKDRGLFFFSLKNGDKENFFGATVAATPVDQALTLQHLDLTTTAPASLEVVLQGATFVPHQVRVQLNGVEVGVLSFDNQDEGSVKLAVPQGLLREGANQVTLTAQGGDSDYSFVDYVRLSYWHSFTADGDALRLTAAGKQQVTIAGFAGNAIRVIDVTDPNAAQELQGKVIQQGGGFAVKATPVADGQRTVLALTETAMRTPEALSLNQPSNWRSATNGADLVIIAHKDFVAGIQPLQALRQRQGLAVTVVDVEDVYDEFSYGQKTPQAIRDFLAFAAATWKRPPHFALLAGNASRDPRNYLGLGDLDFVPTKTIDTTTLETASDDWFVDFGNGGPIKMPVGRLPARTVAQLSAMVAKIIGYEQDRPSEEVLLFADSNSGFDFAAASAQLMTLLPPDLRAEQIDRNQTDAATARAALLAAIERGQKAVNFTGHGSATIWKDFVFTADDAGNLNNAGRLPLFVMMTCLNGYFLDPESSSLAESLMNADGGGAIAVWASSGMTAPAEQMLMDQQLFQLLFAGPGPSGTLGEAMASAKAAIADNDVRRTWILFGDPTTRLR